MFKAINRMEKGLRDLIAKRPTEEFRGVYVESGVSATRRNVLAPGSVGVYSGGGIYNPAQVLRDESVKASTEEIDKMLEKVKDKRFEEFSMEEIRSLIEMTKPDLDASERVWDPIAVAQSLIQLAALNKQRTGYVYVDRDRGLNESRGETQGILTGGEAGQVPKDKVTLFLLRTKSGNGTNAAWWPQIRFPDGKYAFAFAV